MTKEGRVSSTAAWRLTAENQNKKDRERKKAEVANQHEKFTKSFRGVGISQIHAHRHTQKRAQKHTQILAQRHTQIHAQKHTQRHIQRHTLSHTQIHAEALDHS